jgi:hypothetical protein
MGSIILPLTMMTNIQLTLRGKTSLKLKEFRHNPDKKYIIQYTSKFTVLNKLLIEKIINFKTFFERIICHKTIIR